MMAILYLATDARTLAKLNLAGPANSALLLGNQSALQSVEMDS